MPAKAGALFVEIFSLIEFYSPSVVTPDAASVQRIGPNGVDTADGCGTGARTVRSGWSNGIGNSDGRHVKGWEKGEGEASDLARKLGR